MKKAADPIKELKRELAALTKKVATLEKQLAKSKGRNDLTCTSLTVVDSEENACVTIDANEIRIQLPVQPGDWQPFVAIRAMYQILGNGGGSEIRIEPSGSVTGTEPSPVITFAFRSSMCPDYPPVEFRTGFLP